MKARLVVLICGALTLGAAAPAHALKAYIDNRPAPGELADWLVIQARPGEKNFVAVQRKATGGIEGYTSDSVAIAESGLATAGAGPGCTAVVRLINCDVPPHADLVQLELSLGDGNDIDVQNNDLDYVDCGRGVDVVKADPIDWLVGC